MKYIFIGFLLIISCQNKKDNDLKSAQTETYTLQDFMRINESLDIDSYVNNLSANYLELLSVKYNSKDINVIKDSLYDEKKKNKTIADSRSYQYSYTVMDSISFDQTNLTVYKYKVQIYDPVNESTMYLVQLALSSDQNNNNTKKYIPYSAKNKLNTRNIFYELYSSNIASKIDSFAHNKPFIPSNLEQKQILNSFMSYHKLLESQDPSFSNFIHPRLINKLKLIGDYDNFDFKKQLLKDYKNYFVDVNYKYNALGVNHIEKIPCNGKVIYDINYYIKLSDVVYIPGQAIVTEVDNKYYFVEFDSDLITSSFPDLFAKDELNCFNSYFN